jgi:hypothetical protein
VLTFYDTHVIVDNALGETRVNGQPVKEILAAE